MISSRALQSLHCILLHFISAYFLYSINILKPTGYVMHHQFNIQQL
jgi:hypothetical protein